MVRNIPSDLKALPASATTTSISIVMVSYFTGPSLFEAIDAVLADQDICELIIVDNGNSKLARKTLSDYCAQSSRLRILQGHGNIGFGSACNYGAKLARGAYLLFLNPDAIIQRGAARAMAKAGAVYKAPWVAGALLRDENGMEQRGSRRGAVTPLSAFASFTGLAKLGVLSGINKEHEPFPETAQPIPTVSGAAMMMDAKSFEILGGFDERYFLHVEDIDVCRRAQLAGGTVIFVPSAVVKHYGSTSLARAQTVEREKLKSFIRYFWTYSDKYWAKLLCLLGIPFLSAALMSRAWLSALRR